ncbi:MAG: HAD-IIA family hydrolase [Nitrospirae bacterium]|nr:HAD-IIA family hydrolase [Candidatus Manganitrophaceae bacterium]
MTPLRLIDRFDHFLIDLDGVVYIGDRPTPRAAETLNALHAAGKKRRFITNDPRHTADVYAQKLRRLDIPAEPTEFLTSGRAAALYLQKEGRLSEPVFVVGSDGLRSEIESVGGCVLEGAEGVGARIVVVGGHEAFSYPELKIAALAIQRGATFIATNRDATFPMPDGLWPGTGPIVAAIEYATGVAPVVVGKPEKAVFEIALGLFPPGGRTAMIGDRLDSDILGGRRAGLATILVLSGCTSRTEAERSPIHPDYIIENLAQIATPLS